MDPLDMRHEADEPCGRCTTPVTPQIVNQHGVYRWEHTDTGGNPLCDDCEADDRAAAEAAS